MLQAHLGYARDKRFDCKQVLIGLVLGRDDFPKAHEVFEGYRQDRQTLKQMLESLEKRVGRKPGFTAVLDRGMVLLCGKQNLAAIRAYGVRRDFNRQINQILYDIRVVETSDFGFRQELQENGGQGRSMLVERRGAARPRFHPGEPL